MRIVDARGLSCPEPVMLTEDALKEDKGPVKVLVTEPHQRMNVEKYAKEYQVDPLLIFAMIKIESNFNKNAKSSSDAKGLMQLMDATAEDTANKLGMEYNSEDLTDPEINIRLGTKYFSSLYETYKNIPIALTAYNAGSGNVDKWIQEDVISSDGTDIENVPFRETNNYVRKILRDYEIYKDIYNEE